MREIIGNTKHMKTHTGEKPHSCDQREKLYDRERHKITHTGVKLNSCDIYVVNHSQIGAVEIKNI